MLHFYILDLDLRETIRKSWKEGNRQFSVASERRYIQSRGSTQERGGDEQAFNCYRVGQVFYNALLLSGVEGLDST